ncbi:MAG: hypothetical protein RL186_132 [Pseudomonadota bacterium]
MATIAATNTSNNSTSANATSRTALANNFETFLSLLTAQLENQDPLSPLDSKDFTNQLVQFSGVEQQLKTNDLLTALAETTKLSAGATAVAYLGKEATANTPQATITSGGSANWTYSLPASAKSVTLRVLNASGTVVATSEGQTKLGDNSFNWDGKDQAGRTAPAGTYRLEVVATGQSGETLTASILRRGTITGVDLSGTTPSVTLGGASVPLSSIIKVGLQS